MWGNLVREKELRLELHLFLRSPSGELRFSPCEVNSRKKSDKKKNKFFPFMLQTSHGDNLKHPQFFVHIGGRGGVTYYKSAVEMSDYDEKL